MFSCMGLGTMGTLSLWRSLRSGVVRFAKQYYKWYFIKIILAGMYLRAI